MKTSDILRLVFSFKSVFACFFFLSSLISHLNFGINIPILWAPSINLNLFRMNLKVSFPHDLLVEAKLFSQFLTKR